jgi:hypothetical protein
MPHIFTEWQAAYAERGLPTFPVDPIADNGRRKLPCVRGYDKVGLRGSQQLALKFLNTNGLACMAGRRNRLTVIDIDARGAEADRLTAEAMREYGQSRFIVRTGGDGRHLYYRHNGEGRRIRPDPSCPIDILGGGMLVLPPSLGAKQPYEIIEGHLDDLTALTKIERAPPSAPADTEPLHHVQEGERDKTFWPYVARMAHRAQSLDALIEIATTLNRMMPMPLTEIDIVPKCKYWWEKTKDGKNRFGTGGFVITDHTVIDSLMMTDPDAFLLYEFVRRHHWGREFALANDARVLMPGGVWDRKRFAAARARLIEAGYLEVVTPASLWPSRPMICRVVAR